MIAADVSVVVPAFNNWALTQACIERLRAMTGPDGLADVVVVDDGSTDGVSTAWAAAQRSFTPLLSADNRGFSQACNLGASAARGDVLLFLNNDAFVTSGAVAAMRAALADQPAIGIVGAKLVYADGRLQHAGLGLLAGPVSRWWHVHRQLPGNLPDANVARDLLAVTGAALMIRRSLFNALGGFDAGYTNGWEDVDLCLRAWSRGARVRYEPRAVIEHLESATLGRRHDDAANESRFIARWAATLSAAPRYPLAEIPPLAFAVRPGRAASDPDRWALDHVKRVWGAHFGARLAVTRPGSRPARAAVDLRAALAKRRPTLEVSWADATLDAATGPTRVAFVAPRNIVEAQRYTTAHGVSAWWTPTAAGRAALVAGGAPADRVTVVPLGAGGVDFKPRTGPLTVACDDDGVRRDLERRAPHVRTLRLGAGALPNFDAIDIVVARCGGDRWGMLVPAALAHGCHAIVSPPVDVAVAETAGVTVTDDAFVLDTLVSQSADAAAVRRRAPAVRLAAFRRLDATLAAQGAAETARALVHQTPSSRLVEVGPALAAHLRGTWPEASASLP